MWQDTKTEKLVRLFVGVGITFIVLGYLRDTLDWYRVNPVPQILIDFCSETFSILLTVLIVDKLVKQRLLQFERNRLILQISSRDNTLATEALRMLRSYEWLPPASKLLKGKNFSGADLRDAVFSGLDLSSTAFQDAKLSKAFFGWANLTEAQMDNVDLRNAYMVHADLRRVNLVCSSLAKANLADVNFQDANMRGVILRGAKVKGASFKNADLSLADLRDMRYFTPQQLMQASSLEGATLPDGTKLPYSRSVEEPSDWRKEFEIWFMWTKKDESEHTIDSDLV